MTFDFASLAKSLEKAVGGNHDPSTVTQFVNTGFAPLNAAVSGKYDGGLPVGRIIEIFGPESSGKTAIATNCMINAQRAGGMAIFHDHERSFSDKLGAKLGLDLTPGPWRFRKPRTLEDSFDDFIETVEITRKAGLPMDCPIVTVFDSLASMVPASMLDKKLRKLSMADTTAQARSSSNTFKVIAQVAEEYNVCLIFLNQIRTAPGVLYGDPTTTPGGKAPKFYASVRIQLGASHIREGGEDDKTGLIIGQNVTARVVKNKINRPYLKASWRFMFNDDGSGHFDAVGSTLDFMVEKELITKNASWLIMPDGSKFQRSALIKHINENGGIEYLNKMLAASNVEPDVEDVDLEEPNANLEDEKA